MSSYLVERIRKKAYFRLKPSIRGRGKRTVKVIGFDTEAESGRPFLLQINDHGSSDDTRFYPLDMANGIDCLNKLMGYIHEHCQDRNTEYVIFGFNLAYEWTQLFGHIENTAFADVRTLDEFEFDVEHRDLSSNKLGHYHWTVWNDKRQMASVRNLATKRTLHIIDAYRFFTTSLDKASDMLGLGRKHDKPREFTAALVNDPAFRAYAGQDAYLTRRIGEYIMGMHAEYDVPTCMSAPQFAMRVFKHHFLDGEIPLPDEALEQAGLWSYHGGKNGYYLGRPMQAANVYAYDITSAYPEAMAALPDPVQSRWVWQTEYRPGLHGLWRIDGEYRRCRYRGLLKHEHGFAESGPITELWVTSYELDSILATGEFDMTACEGYALIGPQGGSLTRYVEAFFDLKSRSKGALREAAKLFLNSLYGKFFQKVPIHDIGWMLSLGDPDAEAYIEQHSIPGEAWWEAGGLYHPPLASLITGFVRAKIHRLEHRYDALMTSTDGFFARRKPDPADIGSYLGGLTVERGHLTIWRERLYAFRVHGKVAKFALHGFRGGLEKLLKVPLRAGVYGYTAQQMMTLKLSIRDHRSSRYQAGMFAELPFELRIAGEPSGP